MAQPPAWSRSDARPFGATSVLSTNKVIRNTYLLLSMTLLFAALTAGVAMVMRLPYPGMLITLVGYFGLLFATTKLRDSAWGLVAVFALTGFMGYTLGPIVSHYAALKNGGQTVMMAMGGTGAIFIGLSAYALTTRKDFSYIGGFLTAGILVGFLASLGAVFFHLQALSLAGGMTDRGATTRIRIVRMMAGEKKELKVKLSDMVLPGDTIIVAERIF